MKSFLIGLLCCLLLTAGTALAADTQLGVAWVGSSNMADRVYSGFEPRISQLIPGVQLEVHKELGTMDELAALVARWNKEKDGMVILRSNAAEWLGANPPAVPTFIGGCNHPGQLGAVKNLKAPEGNITGVTYYLDAAQQFDVFTEIIPNMTSVLLLEEKGHPSSAIDLDATREVAAARGFNLQVAECATPEDAVQAAQGFSGSAIVIGNSALVLDNTEKIVAAAGTTPVLSYSSRPVEGGALCGFAADDVKLGDMLADSAAEVLVQGKPISGVPVRVDPKPKFLLNVKTAERLGLDVPYQVLEAATLVE